MSPPNSRTTPATRANVSSLVVELGVSTHTAPRNISASAPSKPCSSLPAMGCPPTNRESVMAETTGNFTEPTSVTTPAVLRNMACTPSMTCDTGVATNEISAVASTPQLSMMPRESASASRPLPASIPETCQPDARRPAATEPPMRPSPRTFARLVTTIQRTASERTSWVVSSRHSPGFNVASTRVPMRVRTNRFTSCPTASHMRRTCR